MPPNFKAATTRDDLLKNGFVFVQDSKTQSIKKIVTSGDFQIGLITDPYGLKVTGGLAVNSKSISIEGGKSYSLPNMTTVVNVTTLGSGTATVILPQEPEIGQIIVVKDAGNNAATVNITIQGYGTQLIEGSTTKTISTNYGAYQLVWNGTSWLSIASIISSTGTGDVVGPASSTDTAIARYNGVTGKIIQNSGVTIDGSNNIVTPGDVAINGGDLTSTATTFNLVNSSATTVNFAGGATSAVNVGNSSGTNIVSGKTNFPQGLSGSLTRLTDGTSYIAAGSNVTITSSSNGQIIISAATSGSSGGGGDPDASYLVLAATSSLSNERVFVTSTGLTSSVGIPGGNYTLSINDSVVATVSGTTFTGVTKHNAGLSGSLTRLTDGTSYLIAGSNITITSSSNGPITINSTAGGAPASAQYVVLTTDATLTDERVLTAGSGISISDGGAGSTVTISATASGPAGATGTVQFNDSGSFGGDSGLIYHKTTDTLNGVNAIFSGDLTVNGTTTTINTTNLEVKDSLIGLGFASGSVAQTNGDRGIIMSRQGGSGNRTFYWSESLSEFGVVASTTPPTSSSVAVNFYQNFHAANIQGDIVSASIGFSGSLTKLIDGTSYLIAGNNVTITTGANGAVTIDSAATSGAPSNASYVVLGTNATLTDERVLTAGTGLALTDGGANGNATLAILDSVVATISGSRFTGDVISATDIISSGTFKSLYSVGDEGGEVFLNKPVTNTSINTGVTIDVYQNKVRIFETGGTNRGGFYDITTLSAGVGTDLGAGGGGGGGTGDANATYVVMSATGSLNAERVLTAGTGLTLTDGGANSNATLAINNSVVATVSGTTFTGPVAIKTHSGYTGSESKTITAAVTTTDASTTTIATISGSAGGPGTVYWVEGLFAGHNGTNSFGMAQRHACFYVNAAGTNVNQQGSTNNTVNIGQIPGSWSASLSTSGANIIATVTGQSSTTIDWVVTLRYQAVSGSA